MPGVTFSGIASGIDGDAIIKATIDTRRLVEKPLENKIAFNEKESTAFEEFNTKLLSLNDLVKDFLTLKGGALTKQAVSSNEAAVKAVASNSALPSSTTIDVQTLAKSATLSFNDSFAAVNTAIAPSLSGSSNISFTVGTGSAQETINIDVTSSTTLTDLATSINSASNGKLQATTVNTGTASNPSFILVVSTTQTGVDAGSLSVDVAQEIKDAGIFNTQTLSQAENATFTIAGIGQFERSTNQISDILPGLSIELKQAQSGPVSISVSSDAKQSTQKLQNLIEAINSLISYSKENDKVERVEENNKVANVYSALAKTRVDNEAIAAIRGALSGLTTTVTTSSIRVFPDLGITTERDGTLKFDVDKFTTAMQSDPTSTESLINQFADRLGTTNGIIDNYTRFQGFLDQANKSNTSENESLNDQIARIERSIESQRKYLVKLFANLESKVSQLQAGGNALSSLISSGSGKK